MVWFKVDDKFHSHPKRHRCSLGAIGLWTLAGSWCGYQEKGDGFVPAHMVAALGGNKKQAAELVDALLWEEAEGGWKFHEWTDRNPSEKELADKREATRERVRKAREAAKAKRAAAATARYDDDDGNADVARYSDDSNADVARYNRDGNADVTPTPSPSPSPSPSRSSYRTTEGAPQRPPRKRGTRLPDDFAPDDGMREWAAETTPGVDVDRSTFRFRNHWQSESGASAAKLDWIKAWQNWLLKDHEQLAKANGNGLTRHYGGPGERKSIY